MFWVLAGSTWAIALLSLAALRYPVPTRLRQAVGLGCLALWVLGAWRWWTGALSGNIDAAFFVMLGGLFCDDLITRIGERRAAAMQQEATENRSGDRHRPPLRNRT